jgi:hypothetical protein
MSRPEPASEICRDSHVSRFLNQGLIYLKGAKGPECGHRVEAAHRQVRREQRMMPGLSDLSAEVDQVMIMT